MLNTDKELKLYYSIGEVADMFGVNPSLLRFWEKEFPQISPKTAGRGCRRIALWSATVRISARSSRPRPAKRWNISERKSKR